MYKQFFIKYMLIYTDKFFFVFFSYSSYVSYKISTVIRSTRIYLNLIIHLNNIIH